MEAKLNLIKAALDRYGKLTRIPRNELYDLYEQVYEVPANRGCGACSGDYCNKLIKLYRANISNNQ